jgi:hypothetical protein
LGIAGGFAFRFSPFLQVGNLIGTGVTFNG